MTKSFETLESEIDAALAQWSDALDVRPPDEAVKRTKTATRIAMDEMLLTDAPVPSEATIQRVRDQVHQELSTGGTGPRQRPRGSETTDHGSTVLTRATRKMAAHRWHLSPPAVRAWAAAAMIAIAFGLIYYSGTTGPVGSADEAALDDAVINRFIAVNETLMPASSLTSSISSELEMLEESISTWEPAWTELDELFESLDRETGDQSRTGNESAKQIASIRTPATGVMG